MKYSHLALLLTCLQASQALIFDQQWWTFFIGGRFENRMHFFVFMGKLSIGPSALCMRHSIQWYHCTSFCWTLCRLGKKYISLEWVICSYPSWIGEAIITSACDHEGLAARSVDVCILVSLRWIPKAKIDQWHTYFEEMPFFSFLKQICALHFLPGELMSKQPPILRYHFIPGWTYFGGLDSWCVYSWPWPQFLWTCLVPALNETTKHHIEYRKAIVSGLDSPCCETWRGMAWSTLLQLGIHVCPSKFNLLSDMFHLWRWCTYSWITFSHTRSRGTTHRGWWCVEGGNWTLYIRNWSNCTFPLNLPWMYVLRMWGNSKYESVRRSNRIARRICYLQVTQMLFATDFVHIMRLSW